MTVLDAFFATELERAQRWRAIERATESTTGAVQWRDPRFSPLPWQLELSAVCDQMARSALDRTGLRITLSAPPRHGKTEHVGVGLPIHLALRAWREREPMDVLYATASDDLAKKVSRKVRAALVRLHRETGDDWFAPGEGEPWEMTKFVTAGGFAWMGIGATVKTGGIGARLLVMDDLIGSSKAYRSPASRREILDAVQNDLLSRLEGGSAIQMETRRGIDDTTAYLLREHGSVWKDYTWRHYDPERGYLWPERYGEAWRATMPHLTDSSPVWRSLHQQDPVPEGGTHIQPEWLEATYHTPASVAALPVYDRITIGVDLAATGKTTSDECAFVVIGCRGAYRDVLFVHADRMDYPAARAYLRDLAREWGAHAVVVERAAGGDAMIADLRDSVPGIRGESATRDKVARLMPHTPTMAAGQLRLPAHGAPWVRRFREQLTGFSGIDGEPDDIVDATVWALVAGQGAASMSAEVRRSIGSRFR